MEGGFKLGLQEQGSRLEGVSCSSIIRKERYAWLGTNCIDGCYLFSTSKITSA